VGVGCDEPEIAVLVLVIEVAKSAAPRREVKTEYMLVIG
jgi:hypothetical protein